MATALNGSLVLDTDIFYQLWSVISIRKTVPSVLRTALGPRTRAVSNTSIGETE